MRRIVVVGCQGSGKTRLALGLGQKLSLPVVHLDVLPGPVGGYVDAVTRSASPV